MGPLGPIATGRGDGQAGSSRLRQGRGAQSQQVGHLSAAALSVSSFQVLGEFPPPPPSLPRDHSTRTGLLIFCGGWQGCPWTAGRKERPQREEDPIIPTPGGGEGRVNSWNSCQPGPWLHRRTDPPPSPAQNTPAAPRQLLLPQSPPLPCRSWKPGGSGCSCSEHIQVRVGGFPPLHHPASCRAS